MSATTMAWVALGFAAVLWLASVYNLRQAKRMLAESKEYSAAAAEALKSAQAFYHREITDRMPPR